MRWILRKILQLPRDEEDELIRALLLRFGFMDDQPDAALEQGQKPIEPVEREERRYEVWDRMYF